MSVPVPIAMPLSACASAGASLMPSPTITMPPPWRCSFLTRSAFCDGSTSAMISSMPTSFATACAPFFESPETMVTGSLQELLKNIHAVSCEQVNFGNHAYPYLAASGVTISAK